MIIIHGSEDSLDVDAYRIIDKPLSISEAKKITDNDSFYNLNLITIENGVVNWCYKGTVDECNNSIIATFDLHEQEGQNPILHKLEREKGLKVIRTIRGLLSYFSRTEHRKIIKESLRSNDILFKLNTLESINLLDINDFKKNTNIEVYKFIAFQIAQTYSLIKDNEEIFTKNGVRKKYPLLTPYIDRTECSVEELSVLYFYFLSYLKNNVSKINDYSCKFSFEENKIILIDKETVIYE